MLRDENAITNLMMKGYVYRESGCNNARYQVERLSDPEEPLRHKGVREKRESLPRGGGFRKVLVLEKGGIKSPALDGTMRRRFAQFGV